MNTRKTKMSRLEALAARKACYARLLFLLQASKEETFDSPGLPPGGYFMSKSAAVGFQEKGSHLQLTFERGRGRV